MAKKNLSERQHAIMHYINRYISENSRPPTIREIGRAVKISSTSVVNYNLTQLARRGLLSRDSAVSRGLRITQKAFESLGLSRPNQFDGLVRLKLAGQIVAGSPVEVGNENFATFDDEDGIDIAASMLPSNHEDLYALRVSGDSMIDAMINDGDIVILKKQETANNGDMVAAWITPDDITTLKHFFHEGDKIRLQPANPTLDPIYVNAENVRVQGKVVMVMRQSY